MLENYRRGDKVWARDFQASAGGKPQLELRSRGPWTVPGHSDPRGTGVTYRVHGDDGKQRVPHHNNLKPYQGPGVTGGQNLDLKSEVAEGRVTPEPNPVQGGVPTPRDGGGSNPTRAYLRCSERYNPLVMAWLGGAPGLGCPEPLNGTENREEGNGPGPVPVSEGGEEDQERVYGPPTPRFTRSGRLSRPVVPFSV